jgi:mannose-6-phosphate isomerase-like protein (cupin superfamily)
MPAPINGCSWWTAPASRRSTGGVIPFLPERSLLVERGDRHQIRNTGRRRPLKTLNFYMPPAYTEEGEELPAGKAR